MGVAETTSDGFGGPGYDADGDMTGVSRYAGLSSSAGLVATGTYGYDHDGNLTSLAETDASGSTLPTYTWQYDADNRVTQSGSSYTGDGTVTYGYDAASQLTSASYSSPPSGMTSPQTYSYDPNGNRNSTGYVTGPNNELLSDGTYNYTYLCPCQLAGVDFFRAAVLFSPGREKRVGGAGGGASSPCSPARGGRKRRTLRTTGAGDWQDACPRGAKVGALGGRWQDTVEVRFLLAS